MGHAILLVDDSDTIRMTLGALLEDNGHRVIEASTLAEARARLAEPSVFDAVVIDFHLGDELGSDLFSEIRAAHPRAALVLMSGSGAIVGVDGADVIVQKGRSPDELDALIERAIADRRAVTR
jgi:DNA-binding NtrC family response regulator